MSMRKYIGERYVPIFGRVDEASIEWDNTKPYEPLTVVLYQGTSYTSRQYVPAGVAITNEEFWALTGNYNAQVEQYRQEVLAFDNRITANTDAINAMQDGFGGRITSIENLLDAETKVFPALSSITRELVELDSYIYAFGKETPGDEGAGLYLITDYAGRSEYGIELENECFANPSPINGKINGGCFNTVADAVRYANENTDTLVFFGNVEISETLEISASANIRFENVVYTGSGYAIILTPGYYGTLKLNDLKAATGSGIKIFSEGDGIGYHHLEFNNIEAKTNGIYIGDGDSGIWNCGYRGFGHIQVTDGIGLTMQPKNNADSGTFMGQLNFDINLIRCLNETLEVTENAGWAIKIYIDGNASFQGANFNYCSLERSKAGLWIHNGGTRFHPLYGTFRVYEISSDGTPAEGNYAPRKVFKWSGHESDQTSHIHLDYTSTAKLDFTEYVVQDPAKASQFPSFVLYGDFQNPYYSRQIATELTMLERLCYKTVPGNMKRYTSAYTYEWDNSWTPSGGGGTAARSEVINRIVTSTTEECSIYIPEWVNSYYDNELHIPLSGTGGTNFNIKIYDPLLTENGQPRLLWDSAKSRYQPATTNTELCIKRIKYNNMDYAIVRLLPVAWFGYNAPS